EVGGEYDREQHLPELGRLEAEEADVDPPARATGSRDGEQYEAHYADRAEVEQPGGTAVEARIDQRGHHETGEADGRVQGLPPDGAAAGVVRRDPVDRPKAVGDEAER